MHPDYLSYDQTTGLVFGQRGISLKPAELSIEPKLQQKYEKERWEEHADNCLIALQEIKKLESYPLRVLSKIINCDKQKTEGLVALAVALHDLGKLNEQWQKSIGVEESDFPLAHVQFDKKTRIAHAPISADAAYPLFKKVLANPYFSLAFKLAIAHHHHTRAVHIDPYAIKWGDLYERLIKKISEGYSLEVNVNDIRTKQEFQRCLETSMFDLEAKLPYTAYCIVARFIRLCDRKSFSVSREKT